jgi:hypothetical protein
VSHALAGWNGNLRKMDKRLSLQGTRYPDNVRFPMLALCFFSKFLYRHVKLRRNRVYYIGMLRPKTNPCPTRKQYIHFQPNQRFAAERVNMMFL